MAGIGLAGVGLAGVGWPGSVWAQGQGEKAAAPRQARSYWLWAGVVPQPVLATGERLYLLYAEVRPPAYPHRETRILAQRSAAPRLDHGDVWMVLRADTLDWTPQIWRTVRAALGRWHRAGTVVRGVQIDFDAATKRLDRYADFLRQARQELPREMGLSITGLMDWMVQGRSDHWEGLREVVDEVVIQTYQGRRTLPDVDRYMAAMGRVPLPFRIGVVQGSAWHVPAEVKALPFYRGEVVFLLNQPAPDGAAQD